MKTANESNFWPCACVKRNKAGVLMWIKVNSPAVKKCKRCGSVPVGSKKK